MKNLVVFILGVTLLAPALSSAACSPSSMAGIWDVKYRLTNPQQVGICTYIIDQSAVVDGACLNLTYGQRFDFFDARTSIKSNCKFKSTIYLTDGSLNTVEGTVRPNSGYASGKLTAKSYGRTFKGTFSMKRR